MQTPCQQSRVSSPVPAVPRQQSRSNCPRTEAVLPHITSQLETHSHLLYNVLYIGEQRSTP